MKSCAFIFFKPVNVQLSARTLADPEASELQTNAAAPHRSPGRPCAGLWLIANAFYRCLERHPNAPAHNYHTGKRRFSGLVSFFPRFYSPFLDRCKLKPSSQDSVAGPVRLLLRDVASLPQSWCWRKTGAEITKAAQRTGALLPDPICAGRSRLRIDAPCRESLGCGSSSSWGGGLTLLMRLGKLGLFISLQTGASFRFWASINYFFVFQQQFVCFFMFNRLHGKKTDYFYNEIHNEYYTSVWWVFFFFWITDVLLSTFFQLMSEIFIKNGKFCQNSQLIHLQYS